VGRAVTTLEESYAECRQLNKAYGTTYYAATMLLPRVKRHYVHALYGFCRRADDIVDELGPASIDSRARALSDFGELLFSDLEHGDSEDLVLKAVVHTVKAFDLNPDCFQRFLRSMTMDLSVEIYDTFPILEPTSGAAFRHARDLGLAFQLTNFLRDVNEDLDRHRVYIPQEDLARFDADPWARRVTPQWRALMAFEITRTRDYYASADLGIPMLPVSSARCIRAARRLYAEILDRIERADADVFTNRARVPTARKAFVVGRSVLRIGGD
jgi:phytoene synthase